MKKLHKKSLEMRVFLKFYWGSTSNIRQQIENFDKLKPNAGHNNFLF